MGCTQTYRIPVQTWTKTCTKLPVSRLLGQTYALLKKALAMFRNGTLFAYKNCSPSAPNFNLCPLSAALGHWRVSNRRGQAEEVGKRTLLANKSGYRWFGRSG
jgi:hypothetical protein